MERLKGEHDALVRCSGRTTRVAWEKAIEVMNFCPISDTSQLHQSHLTEIARGATQQEWKGWVRRCESENLTVSQLRGLLLFNGTQAAAQKASEAAPQGKYPTIVVDPPWSYQNKSGRQKQDYADRTMTLEQVKRFDIQRWIPDGDCHLWLWVTDAYAGNIYQVVEAWGFIPKAWLVWVKDRIGMGNYLRHQHEFCILATRGKMRLLRRDVSTILHAKMTRHSEKPEAFYRLVESCCPGPYLDVFARRRHQGWDAFGDEVDTFTQLELNKQ